MAAKQKTGATRSKVGRKKAQKTMNQFATTARRKTKKLGRDIETDVENASEWVGDQASTVGAAMTRPVLTAMFATAMAWPVGLRVAATVADRWLAVSAQALNHPWWKDAQRTTSWPLGLGEAATRPRLLTHQT